MDFLRKATGKAAAGIRAVRIVTSAMIGIAKGNIAAYYDKDHELQKKEMNLFWESLNGCNIDYDDLLAHLKANPSTLPKIQALFDLLAQRMGRVEKPSDEFIVDEPTAVAFMYRVLVEEHPEMSFTRISEADARLLIDSDAEPNANLPETAPYGYLGGKKRKSKSSKKSKKNKSTKSKKCNKSCRRK